MQLSARFGPLSTEHLWRSLGWRVSEKRGAPEIIEELLEGLAVCLYRSVLEEEFRRLFVIYWRISDDPLVLCPSFEIVVEVGEEDTTVEALMESRIGKIVAVPEIVIIQLRRLVLDPGCEKMVMKSTEVTFSPTLVLDAGATKGHSLCCVIAHEGESSYAAYVRCWSRWLCLGEYYSWFEDIESLVARTACTLFYVRKTGSSDVEIPGRILDAIVISDSPGMQEEVSITIYPESSARSLASAGQLGYRFAPLALTTTVVLVSVTAAMIYEVAASLLRLPSEVIRLIEIDGRGLLGKMLDRKAKLKVRPSFEFFQSRKAPDDPDLPEGKHIVFGKFFCSKLPMPIRVLDPMELAVGCPLSDLFPMVAAQFGLPDGTEFDLFHDPLRGRVQPTDDGPRSLVFALKPDNSLPDFTGEWQQDGIECAFHEDVSIDNWYKTDLISVYEYGNDKSPRCVVRTVGGIGVSEFFLFVKRVLGVGSATVLFYDGPFGIINPSKVSDQIAFRIVEGVSQKEAEEMINVIALLSGPRIPIQRQTTMLLPCGSRVSDVRRRLKEGGFLPLNARVSIWLLGPTDSQELVTNEDMIIRNKHCEIRCDLVFDSDRDFVNII
jgi:hypothetical protein